MIINKLSELKKQNKSIEEIYKYTTDIIFEEEDEDEEDKGDNDTIEGSSSFKEYFDE